MLGFQTHVIVVGGTAFVYLLLILLNWRRRGLSSWLHGLFFLYLLLGIVWAMGKALSVSLGVIPEVPLYAGLIARDTMAMLPVVLAALTLLFFERPGADRVGIVGAIWVAIVVLVDSDLLGLKGILRENLRVDTPEQTVSLLILIGWAGFTGSALVISVWDYIRVQRPLHRNRILYWVTATILIGLGEGLTILGDLQMTQVGAFVRMLGVMLIGYATLTYYLPSVRNVVRRGISVSMITLVTAALFLGSFIVLRTTIESLPSGYALVGAAVISVLVSIVFQPVRSAAASLVDRFLIGEGYDPAHALREYSTAITSILELNTLATMAVGTISEALEVRRGALLLMTEHNDRRVEVHVIPGMGEVTVQSAEFDPDSPILAHLRQVSLPLSQYEIDVLPELRLAPLWERAWLEQLNMELYVPIRHQSLLVGILALGGKAGDAPYTTQDMNVLSTLAGQTAVALQNARLVSDLKKLNVEMAALNEELRRTNRRLEKLDAAKTHFIQIASHELRTPLTQVRGYADIMADAVQSDRPTPSQMSQISQGISRATVRLEEIISAMLDISEIDAESLSLYRTPLALPTVMRMVFEQHQEALKQRKQTMTTDNLEGLPSVHGDLQRLCQAVNNIVSNCIKFTPDGGSIHVSGRRITELAGKRITESLSNGTPHEYVEILIADTGIGIDPEDQELIFEKFYRVGSPDLHSTGTVKFKGAGPGLGLAITRGILQAHGGKVWVESPGHDEVNFPGSTFHILLPAATSPMEK
jgi:signal transduction histidine kinase